MKAARAPAAAISAVVSDVDGTLVTDDKVLTARAAAAVSSLRDNGIAFAIVSSRPLRGLSRLIQQLGITAPVAGFNGGVVATPEFQTIAQHQLDPEIAARAVEMIEASTAQAWVFAGWEWYIRDPDGPHVAHERHTVGFDPITVDDFAPALKAAAKIVAVSEDPKVLAELGKKARAVFQGNAAVVQSQSYYLDLTHPRANKGDALREIAAAISVPLDEIAVIGDGDNDIEMFGPSGLSIAMGNGSKTLQAAADFVTGSNNEDGFAAAIDRFVLGNLSGHDR